MANKKSLSGYITKKVSFHGKELTLYSLDGTTWSNRPEELQMIIERHQNEQAGFSSDLKGEEREKGKAPLRAKRPFKAAPRDDDDVIDDDLVIGDEDVDIDIDIPDEDDIIPKIVAPKAGALGSKKPLIDPKTALKSKKPEKSPPPKKSLKPAKVKAVKKPAPKPKASAKKPAKKPAKGGKKK